MNSEDKKNSKKGTAQTLEEGLKKSVSEMLFLFFLKQKDCYINEIMGMVDKLSGGSCNVAYPYAMIYRLETYDYIHEAGKRIAEDGRRRQYYSISPEGVRYLDELVETYERFAAGVANIFKSGADESI